MIVLTHGILASSRASAAAFDTDAAAFFARVVAAGGTLTSDEQNAVNQLVLDLKGYSIWTKMRAIYPVVGSSAAACAQNLKSSSYTGTFNGGWEFNATGVTPNGVNTNMATGLVPLDTLSSSSSHLSFYSRTNINQAVYDFSGAQHYALLLFANTFYVNLESTGQYNATEALSDTRGFFIGTRTNNTNVNGYRNGAKTIDNVAQNATLVGQQMFLSAADNAYFSTKEWAFASIGSGLTDTEAFNFDAAVQAFQTALDREIAR